MYQPLQQEVVGFYDMMELNPFSADLLLKGIQPRDKRIMFQFMGRVAGVAVQPLDTLLIAEMFDHVPVQKTEQRFQLTNPLADLAGLQQLIKM
jgi:hypothetical protein